VPVIGKAAPVAQGTTPIVAAWDYNALAWRDGFAGNPKAEVVVPSDAVVAGVYIQAISAYAPHLNAAKLWEEYLYSDEGQLLWLAGYCHPIRFNDLASKNAIPKDLLDKLPDPALYAKAVFPTLDDQAAANTEITKNWDSVVGANVQ
jgi:putative spermidine/putrescine transport system substrate-binding protein